ncbi:hypothetical protein [Mycobacterium paraffinicum]|uniref:hypothetical protein n=1 Tax=Mycobacterium paraffinicum TaxID=53378 RepID=UPI001ABF472B|nr:hypothetical protein [Mycobacterium paraffinicum]
MRFRCAEPRRSIDRVSVPRGVGHDPTVTPHGMPTTVAEAINADLLDLIRR